MTKNDEEAFEEWKSSKQCWKLKQKEIWEAACDYKNKEIKKLKEENINMRWELNPDRMGQ